MSKDDMILLHGLLYKFEVYLAQNVQNDKDGALVQDVHRFAEKVENIIQPGS